MMADRSPSSPPEARPVIVDSDPGVDDCLALCMLLNSPQDAKVLGVTATFGNAPLDVAVRNAKFILRELGKAQIPVLYGAAGPLDLHPGEKVRVADFVHGKDGLGDAEGMELPSPEKKPIEEESASEFILRQARKFPSQLELITLGPLTNLALALRVDPEIVTLIKEVAIMGGAFSVNGNVNPAAEANIFSDPLAADIVFSSGLNIRCIGLDVTSAIRAGRLELDRLATASASSASARLCWRASRGYEDFHKRTWKTDGIVLHDPTVAAYFLKPEYFEFTKTSVRVVRDGTAKGATIFNQKLKEWGSGATAWAKSREVHIALSTSPLDASKIVGLCIERIIGKSAAAAEQQQQQQQSLRGSSRGGVVGGGGGGDSSSPTTAAPLTSDPKIEHRIENYGREIKRAKVSGKEYEMQKQRICVWCSRMYNVHRKTSWFCKDCNKPYCRDGTNGRSCFSAHIQFGEPKLGAYKEDKGQSNGAQEC